MSLFMDIIKNQQVTIESLREQLSDTIFRKETAIDVQGFLNRQLTARATEIAGFREQLDMLEVGGMKVAKENRQLRKDVTQLRDAIDQLLLDIGDDDLYLCKTTKQQAKKAFDDTEPK